MQTGGTDKAAIGETLAEFNAALNSGQTMAVLPLYASDGVFMAPFTASNAGIEAIRAAYDAVFSELTFNVVFTVEELVQLSPDWAFVRTNSAGTTRHASTGTTTAEANQELFLLQKGDDARWRIARYSFSPTNPPGRA
jgi:uncharacterized protein (TIGR02246 family)